MNAPITTAHLESVICLALMYGCVLSAAVITLWAICYELRKPFGCTLCWLRQLRRQQDAEWIMLAIGSAQGYTASYMAIEYGLATEPGSDSWLKAMWHAPCAPEITYPRPAEADSD